MADPEKNHGGLDDLGLPQGLSDYAVRMRRVVEEGDQPIEQVSPDIIPLISEDTVIDLSDLYLVSNTSRRNFFNETGWDAPSYYRAAVKASEFAFADLAGKEFDSFSSALTDWSRQRFPTVLASAHDVLVGAAIVINAFKVQDGSTFLDSLKEFKKGEWKEGFDATSVLGNDFGSPLERGRNKLFIPEHQGPLKHFIDHLTLTSITPEAHIEPMRLGAIGMYRAIENVFIKREPNTPLS